MISDLGGDGRVCGGPLIVTVLSVRLKRRDLDSNVPTAEHECSEDTLSYRPQRKPVFIQIIVEMIISATI